MSFDPLLQMPIVDSLNDNYYEFNEEELTLAMDSEVLFCETFGEELEEFSMSNYQDYEKERNEAKTASNGSKERDFGNSEVTFIQSSRRSYTLPAHDKAGYNHRTDMNCGFQQHVCPPLAERRSVSPDAERRSSTSSIASDDSMILSSMSQKQLHLELGQSAARLSKCIERSKASRFLVAENVSWSQPRLSSPQGC